MARTLSDALIIAIIESATRLAGGRGPISGPGPGPEAMAESGGTAVEARPGAGAPTADAATAATDTPAPDAATPATAEGSTASEHDSRSASEIASDFKTIYGQIESLVRESAEQETPRVGFGPR